MIPQPPPGQGPIDPRGAFSPPPPPPGGPGGGGGNFPAGPPAAGAGPYGRPPGVPLPPPPVFGPGGYPPPGGAQPGGFPPFMPRRGGGWRAALWTVVLLLLLGSVVVNVILLVANYGGGGGNQTVLSPGNGTDRIVVIPLTGVIDEHVWQRFDRFMKRAEADGSIKAVVLRIDTPGGTVSASDEIHNRIVQYKQALKEKGQTVPIVVSMGGFATSGGYYAACAGDYLFAEHTTITGNIGVLWPNMNFSGLMQKYGVEDTTIVSSGAPYKDAGSSTRAPDPAHAQYMQHLIDVPFQRFKDVVSAGRTSRLSKKIDEIANGQAYTADEAKTLGLVDDIGYLDNAIKYATAAASLKNPQVVKYQEPPTFFGLLESDSLFNGRRESSVTIHVDASAVDRLTSPQMMYLYRGPGESR